MEIRKRYCKTLFLKDDPDLIRQYIEIHKPDKIWPEIVAGIYGIGVYEMEIYKSDRQLFMIMEADPGFNHDRDMKDVSSLPRQVEWEEYVGQFQEVYPGSSANEKWVLMDKVFGLDEKSYERAINGQEKLLFPAVERFCKTLKLTEEDELLQEYLKYHKPGGVWPEIIRGIREIGVLDQEIYLKDYKLFLILETVPGFKHEEAMGILADKPRQAEWESLMSRYQEADPEQSAGKKWLMCERIFRLSDSVEN
ncbi:L-rhamnose mutarotase [Bacteroidota bacterium]